VRLFVALALLAVGGALREWLTPSVPPFRGRLAWFIEAAYVFAGQTVLLLLWVLLAIASAPADSWL
jgi:hypothetical protein